MRNDGKFGDGTGCIDHQCLVCLHFGRGGKCTAFPTGIPDRIRSSEYDHRQPYPGDNGIRFEPLPGKRHPLDVIQEAGDGPG